MITTNQTLKQQVRITPEFLESIENGVKYFLDDFEKETECKSPFYYLTHFSNDLDDKTYTLRISNKKEKYAYCTVEFSEDDKGMEKQKNDFMELNKHLNLKFNTIDVIDDDFVRGRATLRFEVN